MVYFDTNVLIYAFCKNVDNISQQAKSVALFDKGIMEQNIILSEVVLCEFAFISHKLKEELQDIEDNLHFLLHFVKDADVNYRMVEILSKKGLYASSFDVYHLAFAEHHKATLYTFDKGYKKLNDISKVSIKVL